MISINTASVNKRKILLLDDEERVLIALRAVLRHQYSVTIVTEGVDALEKLRQDDFHVFVSDQRMPNMTGVEVLRQAREIAPATTRLLLTGYSDLAAIVGSVNESEVFRFINKPWDNNELLALINQAADIAEDAKHVFKANPALLESTSPAEDTGIESASPDVFAARLDDDSGEPVLILDPDRNHVAMVREGLRGTARLLTADSTDDALTLLAENAVGLIIVDISAGPGVIELLKVLKQEYPHVLSIVTTEHQDSTMLIELINQVKIFRYLHKPYRMGLLKQYAQSALTMNARFKAAPVLVKQQAAQQSTGSVSVTASLLSKVKSLGARLKLSFSN
ncbi:MAG: response regulator [Fluviicoccus sp.]|uniref:response regulator n=1 Tax=Fluviicoccus sp. TaxID=2003552 RepID=UPI002728A1FF|nr:response regulator [Fluviicoccus sp.]MDO8330953.1 response regulator [Fluviicoccus sp.]